MDVQPLMRLACELWRNGKGIESSKIQVLDSKAANFEMTHSIRSPRPALMSDAHIYISGNVTIHPSAAIAPSVMLQADPDSQLVVAAGACIGVGCVLHAHQGILEVEAGATLGSGVLIIGQGTIGANACIGAMTTIINSSIPPEEIVPPGSLIGDRSRQVVIVEASEPYVAPSPAPSMSPTGPSSSVPEQSAPEQPAPSPPGRNESESQSATDVHASRAAEKTEVEAEAEQPSSSSSPQGTVQVVYGRTYLEQMMIAMFPHRQPLDETE